MGVTGAMGWGSRHRTLSVYLFIVSNRYRLFHSLFFRSTSCTLSFELDPQQLQQLEEQQCLFSDSSAYRDGMFFKLRVARMEFTSAQLVKRIWRRLQANRKKIGDLDAILESE